MKIQLGMTLLPLAVGLAMTSAGCSLDDATGPDDLREEGLGTVEQDLNGTISFAANCTTAMRTSITNAVNYAVPRLGFSSVAACMRGVTFYEPHNYTPESMIARVRVMPTSFQCLHLADGGATAGVGPYTGGPNAEAMTIDPDEIAGLSMELLAEMIVHEVAHAQGWNHPGATPNLTPTGAMAYEFSVPEQLSDCMLDQNGFGQDDSAPGLKEAELAHVGGAGGVVFRTYCPVGTRVIGATAYANASQVNGLRFHCSNGTNAGLIGTATGTALTKMCGAGESVAGFQAREGTLVRMLSVGCEADADLVANLVNTFSSWTVLGGAGGPVSEIVPRTCPAGHAVVGALGRAGGAIDSLRFVCRDLNGPTVPDPYVQGLFGTANAGTMKSTVGVCPDYGAVKMLWGAVGAEVDYLGGLCLPRTAPASPVALLGNIAVTEASYDTYGSLLDYGGGAGGGVWFQLSCPDNMAVVGLRARSGARVNAVGAICANTQTWSTGNLTTTNLPLQGGSGGTYSTITCPSRHFVAGLQTWAKATPELSGSPTTVHGLSPICRKLD